MLFIFRPVSTATALRLGRNIYSKTTLETGASGGSQISGWKPVEAIFVT
jgi:hypothetical protein